MKKFIIFQSIILTGCMIGAGTLGGFDTVLFSTSKQNIVTSIDSLYKAFPDYKIPDHWQRYDNWSERGFDFLDSRIFYFKSTPEEMYYVTFLGDANDSIQKNNGLTEMAIRAYMKSDDLGHWNKEGETSSNEKTRIQTRFQTEIVSKINAFVRTAPLNEN